MLSNYKLKKIARNLEHFFDKASYSEYKKGLDWYLDSQP